MQRIRLWFSCIIEAREVGLRLYTDIFGIAIGEEEEERQSRASGRPRTQVPATRVRSGQEGGMSVSTVSTRDMPKLGQLTCLTVNSDGTMLYVGTLSALYTISISGHRASMLLAGSTSGETGFKDGGRDEALFDTPRGLAVSCDGHLFVADWGNNRVRWVTQQGTVSTVAGSEWKCVDDRPRT
mmetsp:Transcript_84697/g.137327  ORF Transcript_84697/g.137327 Transcript_84697/m.137327 type:complete len:183 (+) Transcript_84697:158-706(+)